MEGLLFRFGSDCEDDKHLIGFISGRTGTRGVCKHALVLIPGLTDGMMTMAYTEHLSEEVLKCDYSLVQVNLGSSFLQFGISSLRKDCEEVAKLLGVLKERFNFDKIVILGHSTGAQDTLYFLRHGEKTTSVSGIILQGAVSDRECLKSYEQTARCLVEAQRLKSKGKLSALLSERVFGAPITAERFLSLTGQLTADDMFSTDLTATELEPILSPVKVPILLCFSSEDEFVPNKLAQKSFAERMVSVLRSSTQSTVECQYLSGDHGLSRPEHYQPFVKVVCHFIAHL